ncbi:MAG: YeiH family protein [Ilumatobacteraceae bacterium]
MDLHIDRRHSLAAIGPGVAVAAGVVAVIEIGASARPGIPAAALAVAGGILIANTIGTEGSIGPGLQFAGRQLLRVGIVLLGFRLSLGDVVNVGLPMLIVVGLTVAATFWGTQRLGRVLGVGRDTSLLTATGYSICGASAIAAMNGTVGADDEDAAVGIALVTIFGTIAVFALPVVGPMIGFEGQDYGAWVGASTHDVAQVVAAASVGGTTAATTAVVVKLTRVALLAPLVVAVGLARRKQVPATAERPPLLPWFVVWFLAAVVVRSTGVLGHEITRALNSAGALVLSIAMVGLGAGVSWAKLRSIGPRPLALGAVAWVLVAGLSAIAVAVVSS